MYDEYHNIYIYCHRRRQIARLYIVIYILWLVLYTYIAEVVFAVY